MSSKVIELLLNEPIYFPDAGDYIYGLQETDWDVQFILEHAATDPSM